MSRNSGFLFGSHGWLASWSWTRCLSLFIYREAIPANLVLAGGVSLFSLVSRTIYLYDVCIYDEVMTARWCVFVMTCLGVATYTCAATCFGVPIFSYFTALVSVAIFLSSSTVMGFVKLACATTSSTITALFKVQELLYSLVPLKDFLGIFPSASL